MPKYLYWDLIANKINKFIERRKIKIGNNYSCNCIGNIKKFVSIANNAVFSFSSPFLGFSKKKLLFVCNNKLFYIISTSEIRIKFYIAGYILLIMYNTF